MGPRRLDRLNALLKEVIAHVIHKDVRDPNLPSFITVTDVEVTKDLSYGKVFISVIGDHDAKKKALLILQNAAGFIRTMASKEVEIRFFPELTFYLDESVEKQLYMEELISKVQQEREQRLQEHKESREDHE